MKLMIFIISILSQDIVKTASETCSEPEIYMSDLHILRFADVNVTVYRCYSSSHSDITKNCINAFNTGLFIDKWSTKYYRNNTNSPIKFETYTAKANVMQNEIRLRSGTVCRYDRGFCYDLNESIDFAVVWEITHEKPKINDKNLIGIFYGPANVWQLRKNSLTYVVLQESGKDYSFALRLLKASELNGTRFWYTDYDMIITEKSFKKNLTRFWDKKYFPLKPKQIVSEQLLSNCDLEDFPLNFEKNTYGLNENNLVAILNIFQTHLIEIEKKLNIINEENFTNNKTVTELQKDLRSIKSSLKDQEVAEIRDTIKNMSIDLSKKYANSSKQQKEIEQILIHQKGEIQNKYIELQKEQVNITNQLVNMELDLNGRNNDTAKFQIHTNLILMQHQKDIYTNVKDLDKLGLKYNNILIKLNLHDEEISKCQNYTTILLSNKDKLLNVTDDNIRNMQGSVQQLEEKIMDLLIKDIELEKNVFKIDLMTTKLEENITRELQEFIVMVKESNKEIKTMKEKSEDCRKAINQMNSEEVQRNLTDMQNILAKQDKDILKLQGISKDIYEELNDYKRYVNKSCQTRDEEISQIYNVLLKQDVEIKKLYEYVKKIDERSKGTEKELKERDDERKRIQNNLIIKDEEFRAERNKRDQEYKKLEEKMKKIEQYFVAFHVDEN